MTLYEVVKKSIMLAPIDPLSPERTDIARHITNNIEDFIANKFQTRINSPEFREMQKIFEEITGRKVTP